MILRVIRSLFSGVAAAGRWMWARMPEWIKKMLSGIGAVTLLILAILSVVFFGRRSRHFEALEERQADRAERADAERELDKQKEAAAADREQQVEDAQEQRKKILSGTLGVLLVLAGILSGCTAVKAATAAQGSQAAPFIPGDYDTLRKYYLATWDLSEKWWALYMEAEQDAAELRESNQRLLAIIDEQHKEIEGLRSQLTAAKRPGFGLVGGATWSPGSGPGVFLGGAISW